MNDVDFGTVRLKQDVGPGIYTNTYACQFHSHSLSLLVPAVHFGVFHWSSLYADFQRSTLHQSNHKKSHSTLKGERVKFLVYPMFLHLGGGKHCFLEGTRALLLCPSDKCKRYMNMSREHWWNNCDMERPKHSDKNLSHYYYVDRKSHMD